MKSLRGSIILSLSLFGILQGEQLNRGLEWNLQQVTSKFPELAEEISRLNMSFSSTTEPITFVYAGDGEKISSGGAFTRLSYTDGKVSKTSATIYTGNGYSYEVDGRVSTVPPANDQNIQVYLLHEIIEASLATTKHKPRKELCLEARFQVLHHDINWGLDRFINEYWQYIMRGGEMFPENLQVRDGLVDVSNIHWQKDYRIFPNAQNKVNKLLLDYTEDGNKKSILLLRKSQ